MSLKLSTPGSFIAFPFSPYDIQLDLMRHLYSSIEDRKVTIVESPTGTGKTLSLLCSSLTWLKDEQSRAQKGKLAALTTEHDVGPDWVLAQTLDRRRREMEMEEREYAERLAKARKKEEEMRRLAKGHVCKRLKLSTSNATLDREDCELDDDATFLPDSDSRLDGSDDEGNISPAVRALMQKLQHGASALSSPNGEQQEPVLHELRKLKLDLNMTVTVAPSPDEYPVVTSHPLKRSISMLSEDTPDLEDDNNDGACARTVSLGSRKQLCINESLRGKAGDLDEACRQMLGEKGKKRCPHLPPIDEETRMLDLRDQILATPKDIEDLLITGKAADTCPYFGSRRAIPQAQLVLLPYNLLLQKTAREALGIDLTDQVVIIDEAHNLISTLLSLSTTRLPLRTLSTARHQLSIYLGRFRTRLTTTHALHLKRLTGLLDALSRFAEEWQTQMSNTVKDGKTHGAGVEVITSGELLQRLGRKTEGVNLLEVESYLRNSKIARKISGYSVKALEKAAGQDATKLAKLARLSSTTPPLHAVESFITALTAASDDGRVTFSIVDNQVEIKYQHLNPSTYFQEVIDSARSVVLAGGTMSPISDITNQLFANLSIERLSTFSCGHIIPASNLQTLVLKKGPRGSDLLFKYEQRGDQALIAELGQILFNFANVVHAGIVVFLPSYAFLNTLASAWERSGVMEKLKAKKKVFLEPQDSVQTENVLREYAAVIHDSTAPCTIPGNAKAKKMNGALLFAVIGAKLSEGLNFTDDLARAVVIIGLPFANLASPELRERMNYVNRLDQRHRGPEKPAGGAKDAATELYENMCMNAVNQSIGRAIRHQGDWASLVLIDGRYASTRIRNKLPKWIGEGTVITDSFGQAMGELGRFHRDKRGL